MAVLTYSEIEAIMLDDLVANVSTDAPITSGVANEAGRYINDAYATIWEMSGGRVRKAPSANAWTSAQVATGTVQGTATDIAELLHVYATATAPAAISTVTNATTTLTSTAAFGSVVAGMHISGTGIPTNTYVASVESTSSLTMTRAATDSTTNNRTFSHTIGAIELERVELARIQWLRASGGTGGTYTAPTMYAPVFVASPGSTIVNLMVLEYYPSTTGYYFPIHYRPQFVPLDATITTPDVNDLESRDIGHLAALNRVAAAGRADLAPTIAMLLSENTRLALDRKIKSMLDAGQDR